MRRSLSVLVGATLALGAASFTPAVAGMPAAPAVMVDEQPLAGVQTVTHRYWQDHYYHHPRVRYVHPYPYAYYPYPYRVHRPYYWRDRPYYYRRYHQPFFSFGFSF